MTLSTHDFFPKSFIGFDRLFNDLNKLNDIPNYPPHRIVEISDPDSTDSPREFRIEMAVAGFKSDDLTITEQENVIYVSGKRNLKQIKGMEKTVFSNFSTRDFNLKFKIADNVKLVNCELSDGVLNINLTEVVEKPNVVTHKISTK